MVKRFDRKIPVSVSDYKSQTENAGKVAVFDFDDSTLIAEGDGQSDWLELELLCEELRKNGNVRIVIVPEAKPSIKMFRRVLA